MEETKNPTTNESAQEEGNLTRRVKAARSKHSPSQPIQATKQGGLKPAWARRCIYTRTYGFAGRFRNCVWLTCEPSGN